LFSCAFVSVGCCQAEGPTGGDEEESEKSVSEVNDEDDDEEGSGEVSFYAFSIIALWVVIFICTIFTWCCLFHAGGG